MKRVVSVLASVLVLAPSFGIAADEPSTADCAGLPATLRAEIAKSSTPGFLILFWAPWSAPDRILIEATKAEVSSQQTTWSLRLVDVDSEPDVAKACGVRSIPHLAAFMDGKLVGRLVGARPQAQVRDFLSSLE